MRQAFSSLRAALAGACRNPLSRICLVAGLAAAAGGFLPASPCRAQDANNAFSGLSQSSDQPIDIEADRLTVYDAQKYATFTGNVKAVQGTTILQANELNVHYQGSNALAGGQAAKTPAAPSPAAAKPQAGGVGDGKTKITKIEAKGKVVIKTENDQTTTSDWALYDVPGQMVTVGGNVVLTQGENVLKGNKLVIDLKTGESRFENIGNDGANNRIRALFMPKQEGGADGDKAAGSGTGKAKDAQKSGGGASGAGPTQLVPKGF